MLKSFAPNAGGQDAYSLRAGRDDFELGVFANTYLQVGGHPLSGVSYDFRFDICGKKCWFFRVYSAVGIGISSIGPFAEVVATFVPLSVVRVDISTHFIPARDRVILWSYPLWVGLTIPLDLPFVW